MSDKPAIPAATLVVVRDSAAGPPDLLMVERAAGMAFAAGALVFPGGRIDGCDVTLAAKLGVPDASARIAAIRETLEETAIPIGISPAPTPEQCHEMQRQLLADRLFDVVLQERGSSLDLSVLTPFARWVPKFHATRRFDTLFFVARAPAGDWHPIIVEGECSGAFWISAADALDRERRGEAQLIFPTRRNLERLALHSSFEAIRADALAHEVVPITPWVEEVDGQNFITIPADAGYPVTREKLDGLWRG